MIRYLLQSAGIISPAIVLYYGAPYCPHNTLHGEDKKLIKDIEDIAKKVSVETGEKYRFMRFFPSLSDSSYIRIDDSEESVKLLINNFPGMADLYQVPIDKIQEINIPGVNYGCYGKDAHKWTERVNIPYTFGVLPVLIQKTIDYYLR
jgi:arginine utilization protein RocB